ncbi:MAG TPA: LysR family transcriptional regulator [Polyangiaceae bacterium]|nr:LysR family transcriptional regulator [Polyangiaceae bacterium]
MDIAWNDVRLFLAVAEAGSLSGAARRLRASQPTVSRNLAELEANLGYALFVRSVDGASLTSAGERLLQPARRMAEWAAEVELCAQQGEMAPRGVVRITAPPGVAFDFVAPFASYARKRLPEVTLEVLSSTQYLDLTRREADLALRMRLPEQRDLVRVTTFVHDNAAFATRTYASTLPKGYGPADIDWIGWAPPLDSLPPNPQLAALIPNFRPIFASDDFLVQRNAVESGVGAMFLGRVRHRYSRPTELVALELELGPYAKSELHLVATKSALEVPRIRAVAELLGEELEHALRLSKP